jgi:hypothetical protein
VIADYTTEVSSLDRGRPVLISRAAQKRLGNSGLQPLAPHDPGLSPETAEQIIGVLVRAHAGSPLPTSRAREAAGLGPSRALEPDLGARGR